MTETSGSNQKVEFLFLINELRINIVEEELACGSSTFPLPYMLYCIAKSTTPNLSIKISLSVDLQTNIIYFADYNHNEEYEETIYPLAEKVNSKFNSDRGKYIVDRLLNNLFDKNAKSLRIEIVFIYSCIPSNLKKQINFPPTKLTR
jgi:hypothetical protein